MRVNVQVWEDADSLGHVGNVQTVVSIEHSPREGYDNAVLKELEERLTCELNEGLNAALTTGWEPAKGGE